MLILVLLGMYFDAAVLFVETFLLLFKLALAIQYKVNKMSHVQILSWLKTLFRMLVR